MRPLHVAAISALFGAFAPSNSFSPLDTVLDPIAGARQNSQYPSCNDPNLKEVALRMRILRTATEDHLVGDSLGDYAHDRARCTSVTDVEGLFRFGTATVQDWPECKTAKREMSVDLTHPVEGGGGVSHGVAVGSNYMKIYAISSLTASGKLAGLNAVPVGQTVPAYYVQIHWTDKGTNRISSLTFNPAVQTCANVYSAAGTTRASITRTSPTHWEIVFPPRSIGRLHRGIRPPNWVDEGLFYFGARLAIDVL